MQLRSSHEKESSRKLLFILIFYIALILIAFIFSGQAHWIFYIVLFLLTTIFSSMVFWQEFILPDLKFSEHLSLAKILLIYQFTNSPLILSIKNGEIEGDYLLLKKKPVIKVLNIDYKSAVVIEDSSNQKSLLLSGVHFLKKNPEIIGVFYLGLRSLQIGPLDKSDFASKNSHESLAEYHSRIKTAEQTGTKLITGELIFPSFSVFYRVDISVSEEKDLGLFVNVLRKWNRNNNPLITSLDIDEYIISEIMIFWESFCENKNREEILTAIPDTVELPALKELGIVSRITMEDIL